MTIRNFALVVAFVTASVGTAFAEGGDINPRFMDPPRVTAVQIAPVPTTLPPIVVEGHQAAPISLTAVDRYLLDRSERFRQNDR